MTAALLDEPHSPRVIEALQLIQRSGDTLRSVINDLLDFSKIESGELGLERVPVNPSDELRMVCELLTPQAKAQHDTLALHIGADVPSWFEGDPTRVRQVMLNLVSNAVKFTSNGQVTVGLTCSEGVLELTVTDTGIGMSPKTQQRVFAPFVQADASTTRRFGGTGLGLVITQRLVAAMGGSIAFVSEEGRGTAFTVRLPIQPTAAPQLARQADTWHSKRKRVMVVEDNVVNQVVAVRLLERLGHQAVVAANGEEALRLFASSQAFDVILMDCHMPVLDGFDATRALRRQGVTIPIFALTAAASLDDRARCTAAGMDEVIVKPVRPGALSDLLGTALPELTVTG